MVRVRRQGRARELHCLPPTTAPLWHRCSPDPETKVITLERSGIAGARSRDARVALVDVTRLVVEKDGVYTEFWADSWDVHVQDDGRTLKLFSRGDGVQAAKVAAEVFGASVSEVKTVASSDRGIDEALLRVHPVRPTK